ncbi:MAG: branched-chain amino acid ABC transporter permease [Actinomycetota bacterium]
MTLGTAFSWTLLGQDLLNGLSLGAVFALLGLGVVMIYKSSGVLNFAQGSMGMFATYVYFEITRSFTGIPVVVATLMAIGFGAALGAVVYLGVFKRMQGSGLLAKVIASLAVAGVLQGVAAFLWRNATQARVPQQFPEGSLRSGAIGLGYQEIGTILVTLAVGAGLMALLRYTTFGIALRATAQNRTAARMLGVRETRVAATTWAIGCALAALAGVMVTPLAVLTVYSMSGFMVRGFVAAVVGGFVSLPAAVLGGFTLGAAQEGLKATPLDQLSSVAAGLAVAALLLARVERFFALDQELRALQEAG